MRRIRESNAMCRRNVDGDDETEKNELGEL